MKYVVYAILFFGTACLISYAVRYIKKDNKNEPVAYDGGEIHVGLMSEFNKPCDTVYIHDTIYTSKTTIINQPNEPIHIGN